jgi:hypothetical protein
MIYPFPAAIFLPKGGALHPAYNNHKFLLFKSILGQKVHGHPGAGPVLKRD